MSVNYIYHLLKNKICTKLKGRSVKGIHVQAFFWERFTPIMLQTYNQKLWLH